MSVRFVVGSAKAPERHITLNTHSDGVEVMIDDTAVLFFRNSDAKILIYHDRASRFFNAVILAGVGFKKALHTWGRNA